MIVTTARGGIGERTLGKAGPHGLDSFRRTIDLNLVASLNISRIAASHMAKNEPEDEYAKLGAATVDNPMLNGQCVRLAAGQRFAEVTVHRREPNKYTLCKPVQEVRWVSR